MVTSSFEDRESALISRRYGVPGFFILLLYWNWCSYRLEMGVSGNLWIVVKMSRHLLYMMWKERRLWIQWRGNVLHLELTWGTSIYLHSWCNINVLLLLWQCSWCFHQGNRGSWRLWLGTRNSSARKAGESSLILRRVRSCMSFRELRQAPGVYCRVTARMVIWNSGLFSEVRTPV